MHEYVSDRDDSKLNGVLCGRILGRRTTKVKGVADSIEALNHLYRLAGVSTGNKQK